MPTIVLKRMPQLTIRALLHVGPVCQTVNRIGCNVDRSYSSYRFLGGPVPLYTHTPLFTSLFTSLFIPLSSALYTFHALKILNRSFYL
jgi:hypothetical protein